MKPLRLIQPDDGEEEEGNPAVVGNQEPRQQGSGRMIVPVADAESDTDDTVSISGSSSSTRTSPWVFCTPPPGC